MRKSFFVFSLLSILFLFGEQMGDQFSERKLVLYFRATCGFCTKVDRFMQKNHISIEKKDISSKEHLRDLIKVGGKRQVPCLVIDGKAMYESDKIIQWLDKERKKS